MDYRAASQKIREFTRSLVKDDDEFLQRGMTADAVVKHALAIAWCDAVREEWASTVAKHPGLKRAMPMARKLMDSASYRGDPVCLPPGMKVMIAMVDGKEAPSIEDSMTSAMPLSAAYVNQVMEALSIVDGEPSASWPAIIGTETFASIEEMVHSAEPAVRDMAESTIAARRHMETAAIVELQKLVPPPAPEPKKESDKLWFTKDGKDITEGIELRNGKANPFGWSTHDVWLTDSEGERQIGSLYCGEPKDMVEGYGWRKEHAEP